MELEENEIVEYDAYAPMPIPHVTPGMKYGALTAIELEGKDRNYMQVWRCICACGNYKSVRADNLRYGRVKSCGCKQGLPTVGRPNQMSSRRIPPDDVKYTVDIYTTAGRLTGNKARKREDRIARHDFSVIRAIGKPDPNYQMTDVKARYSCPGQVPPAMSATLARMARARIIGERGNRTVPEWAKDEGVDVIVHHVGNVYDLRAAHDALEGEAIANGYNPKKLAKPMGAYDED